MSKLVTFKRVSIRFMSCLVTLTLVALCFVPMQAFASTTPYRSIFEDAFMSYTTTLGYGTGISNIANGGFSYPYDAVSGNPLSGGIVRDSSPVAVGLKSMRLKFLQGYVYNVLGINFTSNSSNVGTTWDLSSMRNTGALQFYVYPKGSQIADPKVPSFSIELASSYDDGGTIKLVENRISISDYMTDADYARATDGDTTNDWTLVTIPFSDLPDTGTYFDPATGAAVSSYPFDWTAVKGVGFICNTGPTASGGTNRYYDPRVDQVEIVTIDEGPPANSVEVQNFEFTDVTGGHVDTIAEAGNTLKSKMNIVNNSGGLKHVVVIMALYKDGILERVQNIEQDVEPGTTAVPDVELPNPGLDLSGLGAGTYSVRAFVWDGLDSMRPYDIMHPLN